MYFILSATNVVRVGVVFETIIWMIADCRPVKALPKSAFIIEAVVSLSGVKVNRTGVPAFPAFKGVTLYAQAVDTCACSGVTATHPQYISWRSKLLEVVPTIDKVGFPARARATSPLAM